MIRNAECGADGVRGTPRGCENTPKHRAQVWERLGLGTASGTLPAGSEGALGAAGGLAGGRSCADQIRLPRKIAEQRGKGGGSRIEPLVVPRDREDSEKGGGR